MICPSHYLLWKSSKSASSLFPIFSACEYRYVLIYYRFDLICVGCVLSIEAMVFSVKAPYNA